MQENNKYEPTIGLEIHAELKTKTKMFCSCKNDSDEKRPNVNICPICVGHPGTLPVINREAVKHVLKIGLSVNGETADFSEFDRKNYFYPDIPKGYQISQYKYPLISGGELLGIKITRIHLEEDTARSSHPEGKLITTSHGAGERDYSLVDFNRAGVPLMELVTEPVMHSSAEVVRFGEELQTLLQYLNISDANMDKGEMRLEANVSVAKSAKDDPLMRETIQSLSLISLGTKVEVKNLNSFRSAEKAVEYEIKRQIELLENGGKVKQETRGWDEKKQITFAQRSKEDSHDYRYFPDPDLPKLKLSEIGDFNIDILRQQIKETPAEKRERFKKSYSIKKSDIDFYISNILLGALFEKSASSLSNGEDFQLLSNYIVSDIASLGDKSSDLKPKSVAQVVEMASSGKLSSRGAKNIIQILANEGGDPREIAKKEGLIQKNDESELALIVKNILNQNQEAVKEYKAGKTSAIQFLIGQSMKATKGSANPVVLKELIIRAM